VQNAVKCENSTFIPLCDGLSGTIGALTTDTDYECDTTGIPIDTLVAHMTDEVDNNNVISNSYLLT
jgi:hypothetical protein